MMHHLRTCGFCFVLFSIFYLLRDFPFHPLHYLDRFSLNSLETFKFGSNAECSTFKSETLERNLAEHVQREELWAGTNNLQTTNSYKKGKEPVIRLRRNA